MTVPASVTDDEATVTHFLTDYYRDFSRLDIQAILSNFSEPCLVMGPHGVFAAPAGSALTSVFTPLIESLRGRGYGRSELSIRQLKSLSQATALVTGVAVRFKADGQELERVGVTYLLQKAHAHWKIAVLVTHDTE